MTEEKVVIVPERPYANHGSTVATWVKIAIMSPGVRVGAVAYDGAEAVSVFVGAGIIVLGLVAGLLLKSAGYGQGGSKTKNTERH